MIHLISPADLIALSIQPIYVYGIIGFAFTLSLILIVRFALKWRKSLKDAAGIVERSKPYDKVLKNALLVRKLKQAGCRLIVSPEIKIPFAIGFFSKWICLPSRLIHRLTQEELEAIVVHELDHLCWNDSIVRLVCRLISALFWWIPTGWWINRIENYQESACDTKIVAYGISGLDLASAIVKTTKSSKSVRTLDAAAYFAQKGTLLNRLRFLTADPCNKDTFLWIRVVLAVAIATFIFTGRFWMF